jgi:hypothetical protein
MPTLSDSRPSRRPTIAVLTAHWESSTELGCITRHVAGALACQGEVHVIVPGGAGSDSTTDGVFTVHRMATPIDREDELRRDLIIEGFSEAVEAGELTITPETARLLDQGLVEPWSEATGILGKLRPDLLLIAGHQNIGALVATDRYDRDAPVALLALSSDSRSMTFPHFDRLFDRARTVLAVTESERRWIVDRHGRPDEVVRIGAPLAANPSALTEPNTWVGRTDYVLVLTGVDEHDSQEENELSRMLRMRFPDNPVGIAHNDAFCAWHEGRVSKGWPIERSSDRDRLMAWARVTVDLHPERFFARRCLTSMLYGTPIVVPHDSRAREHAELGKGGLWFSNPTDLSWCVEALLDPPIRSILSTQGRAYAEAGYGSRDGFINRVLGGCGLGEVVGPVRIVA